MWRLLPLQRRLKRDFERIIRDNPPTCAGLRQRIQKAGDGAALIALWQEEAHLLFLNLVQLQDALKALTKLVGESEAQAMLAMFSGGFAAATTFVSTAGAAPSRSYRRGKSGARG